MYKKETVLNILGLGVDAIAVKSKRPIHEVGGQNFMKNIQINKILVGHYQPRKTGVITKDSIQDLIASIRAQGVLQPIIVRKIADENYELIAGERRYRSACEAGLNEIPCVIKEVSEKDAFAIALIENIQREQLSLLEESESLLKLKEEHFLTVDEVSKMVGKSRTTVANLIRAASSLSPEGKLLWEKGVVDYGHIRTVIMLSHDLQNTLLQFVVNNELSVRETEALVRKKRNASLDDEILEKTTLTKPSLLNNELKYIVEKFSDLYGKASIKSMSLGRVKVSVEFENTDKIYEFLKDK